MSFDSVENVLGDKEYSMKCSLSISPKCKNRFCKREAE